MFQSIIRDPGGEELIRIQPNICGRATTVVIGSYIFVPHGSSAFVAINVELSPPFAPGRHQLFTGVSPFFVRLRHIMTGGEPAAVVSVFFLSTERSRFLRLGTGEIPFREQRFQITMRALAACQLTLSIANPLTLLRRLIGGYNTSFSEENIRPCLEQIILAPIREALSRELSRLSITSFNSHLLRISAAVTPAARSGLALFGLHLEQLTLAAVHVPDAEMQRLYHLEQDFAVGKNRTDLELDHLKRVWNGNLDKRTISEMMTGFSARGGHPLKESAGQDSFMQLMLLSQLLHPEAQPARPCPHCHQPAPPGAAFCPHCGRRL